MRVIFSIVSLLVVVLVVGFLAKSQLTSATRVPAMPSVAGTPQGVASAANGVQSGVQKPADTVRAVEQSVNATLEQTTKRLEAETK
jgi:hypothetical protein